MKAILLKDFGAADQLYLGDAAKPALADHQVLIRVEAAALNRADILQRKGLYPPPEGTSEILGLEVAGQVVEAAPGATELLGQKVMALLPGGGYAEYVSVHKSLILKIPNNLTTVEAAGLMEVSITAWQALKWLGKLKKGEVVLIHAGASGVGSACIQLAKILKARVLVTASADKHDLCSRLGAELCIDYRTEDFKSVIKEHIPAGADLIIDFIGADYFQKNLDSMAEDGRLVMLGLLGGTKAVDVNLAAVLFKRLTVLGSTLRSRSLQYRSSLIADFQEHCYPFLLEGSLKPVIDKVFPWDQVQAAHEYMEANKNRGKVVLQIRDKI